MQDIGRRVSVEPERYLIALMVLLVIVFCNGNITVKDLQVIRLREFFCACIVFTADGYVLFFECGNEFRSCADGLYSA